MSLATTINEKLAENKKLTDEEVKWASEHAITLPDDYEQTVKTFEQERAVGGRPPEPVFQGGPQFPSATGPGLFLTADELDGLNKDTLLELAEARGMEMARSSKKDAIVAQLVGAAEVPAEEETDEDENEEG